MSNLNITLPVDDYALWRCVCGSGWESWSWWYSCWYEGGDWDQPCTLWVVIEDPYGDDEWLTATITVDDIARAIEEADHPDVMHALVTSDFDACWGDVVMQQAILGEVVYG
jgi:hypothetical protein